MSTPACCLRVLALLCCLLLTACDTLAYYGQAVSGQWQLLRERRPIPDLLADATTAEPLREQLALVQDLTRFAATQLQLPVGRQFSTYADLQRPYVVWNVFAAEPFSLQPRLWCYPVAGCVSYRGYFSEAAARRFAAQLRAEGMDVYVGGVAAYSTLGWFADPLLNTVIGREPSQLAGLVFHELAHQVVYVKGDTLFNESFATTVEQAGLERWLQHRHGDEEASVLQQRAAQDALRRQQFVALVQGTVADLRSLYAQQLAPEQMLLRKQQRIAQLRTDYQQLRARWGGYGGYDSWFDQDLNNAQLLTVATYNDLVPGFRRLLADCSDELSCFYAQVQALAKFDAGARMAALSTP